MAVSDRVKSICVTIDSHLPFDCHASNVARAFITITLASSVTCTVYCPTRWRRQSRAVSSPRGSTTVTLCFMARRLLTVNKFHPAQYNLARVVWQRGGHTDRLTYLLTYRRRASSAVATLAAGAAPHHIQDGGTDTQGPDDICAVIPQSRAPHSGTSETAPIICHTPTYRPTHSN